MSLHHAPATISWTAVLCLSIALIVPGVRAHQAGQPAPTQQVSRQGPSGSSGAGGLAGKTAGQAFKNIQVLQDVPAEKLLDDMQYITVALGVRCDYCHNIQDFSNDDKQPKQTARKMMKMLFAINQDNFNGRAEVSCYTCHQEHHLPVRNPLPADALAAETVAAPSMPRAHRIEQSGGEQVPTVEAILAKYTEAIGGDQALASASSRVIEAERSGEGKGQTEELKIFEKAPNKVLIVAQQPQGTASTGFDGAEAWSSTPRGIRHLSGVDALVAPREGQINPAAELAAYTNKRVVGIAQIGDKKAVQLTAKAPDGDIEQFYFDADTGLLLRRSLIYRTIFGSLLYQADYSDYRKQDGVQIPFRTDWWAGSHGWTETVKSVQTNAPVADAQFEPPARPAPAPPNGTPES